MKEQQEERQNTNNIMEAKVLAQQRHLASNECKYKKLEGQYNILVEVQEALEAKLDEDIERVQEVCCIRHTEQRWLFPISRLVLPLDVFPCLVALPTDKNDSDLQSGSFVSVVSTTRHGNTSECKGRPGPFTFRTRTLPLKNLDPFLLVLGGSH